MTEYVIDIVVKDVWYSNSMRHEEDTFYIKIDIMNNGFPKNKKKII